MLDKNMIVTCDNLNFEGKKMEMFDLSSALNTKVEIA